MGCHPERSWRVEALAKEGEMGIKICTICGFGTRYQMTGNLEWFSECIDTQDLDLIENEKECVIEVDRLSKMKELLKSKIEAFLKILPKYEHGTMVMFDNIGYLMNFHLDNNFSKSWLINLYYLINESIENNQGVYFFNYEMLSKYGSMSVIAMMRKFPNGVEKVQLFDEINKVKQEANIGLELLDKNDYSQALIHLQQLEVISVKNDIIHLTPKGRLLLPRPL